MKDSNMSPDKATKARLLAITVFALLLASWCLGAFPSLQVLFQGKQAVAIPFYLFEYKDVVARSFVSSITRGDQILRVEGTSIITPATLGQELNQKQPGETIRVELARAGQRLAVDVPLQAITLGNSEWQRTTTRVRFLVLPLICFGVSLWMLLAQPTDRNAWLMAWVLVSFAFSFAGTVLPASRRPDLWRVPVTMLNDLIGSSWPCSMLVLGMHFPQRSPFRNRLPWVFWFFLSFYAVILPAGSLLGAATLEGWHALQPIGRLFNRLSPVINALGYISVSIFFSSLVWHLRVLPDSDSRRRLRWLSIGLQVCLTPVFLVFLVEAIFDIDVPVILSRTAFTLMLCMPLVLGYSIIVQRAIDVRVAIREGLQYALASNGLRLMLGLLLLLVAFTVYSLLQVGMDASAGQKLILIAAGILLSLGLLRGGDRLRQAIDRRFFRQQWQADQLLAELGNEVRQLDSETAVVEQVSQRLGASLHVEQIHFLLQTPHELAGLCPHVSQPVQFYWKQLPAWLSALPDETEKLRRMSAQLLLPLPLSAGNGLLVLGPRRSELPYSRTEIKGLESVAGQTALAVENIRLAQTVAREAASRERLNRELEIARDVQERLFPQQRPVCNGVEYAGFCRPALHIGGDYYDYFLLPASQGLGLAIGDISGKGIPASLLMASLQASLRSQAINGTDDLAQLMSNLNQLIFDASPTNRYATFFFAVWNPKVRRLQYVNAGHNAPMILRQGELLRLDTGGPCIGLLAGVRYETGSVDMQPGDLLLGFTDGISEAMNEADDEFGEARMEALLRQQHQSSPEELITHMMTAADAFAGTAPQHDDMTLLVARFT
jgi:phosphoserine phosphatase RsbU/P